MKIEGTITIDGKEFGLVPLESITDNEKLDKKEKTPYAPYDRVLEKRIYYYIDDRNNVMWNIDDYMLVDNERYTKANYFNDKDFALLENKREILGRKIRRWQAQNDEPVNWENRYSNKYYIIYDHAHHMLGVDHNMVRHHIDCTYFSSEKNAWHCLELFRKEIDELFMTLMTP